MKFCKTRPGVLRIPQVDSKNSWRWEVPVPLEVLRMNLVGHFPKKFVTPPCEVPRKVTERLHLRPESVKSQSHNPGVAWKSFGPIRIGSNKRRIFRFSDRLVMGILVGH